MRQIRTILRRQPSLALASDDCGNNAIHWSVFTRQVELIERFAALGTPIDAERADGFTPALLAVNAGGNPYITGCWTHPPTPRMSEVVGCLLDRGANYTISVAAGVGDQLRVERLLLKDARLARQLDSLGESPLSAASRGGYFNIVEQLLEHGADPNSPENDGGGGGLALYWACEKQHLDIVQLLLQRRANPNSGHNGTYCLEAGRISYSEHRKTIEKLLRRYRAYTTPRKMTVPQMKQAIQDGHEVTRHRDFLGSVMWSRNENLIDLYLDSDPKIVNRMADELVYPRSLALIRKLLARGFDPNRSNWLGKTFLHLFAQYGNRSFATVFLEAGADINARSIEEDETPLAAAVSHMFGDKDPKEAQSRRQMVQFLLKRGAATNLPDDEPWATPLAWARKFELTDIEEILLKHGATG